MDSGVHLLEEHLADSRQFLFHVSALWWLLQVSYSILFDGIEHTIQVIQSRKSFLNILQLFLFIVGGMIQDVPWKKIGVQIHDALHSTFGH